MKLGYHILCSRFHKFPIVYTRVGCKRVSYRMSESSFIKKPLRKTNRNLEE